MNCKKAKTQFNFFSFCHYFPVFSWSAFKASITLTEDNLMSCDCLKTTENWPTKHEPCQKMTVFSDEFCKIENHLSELILLQWIGTILNLSSASSKSRNLTDRWWYALVKCLLLYKMPKDVPLRHPPNTRCVPLLGAELLLMLHSWNFKIEKENNFLHFHSMSWIAFRKTWIVEKLAPLIVCFRPV